MSLTRADLRSRVAGAIGLSNVAGSSEQALIDSWLDEAVEQYLIETKCAIDTASLVLTADVGDYTLPSSVLALRNIWIVTAGGTRVNLEPVSTGEILERRRYASTGMFPMVFSLEGFDFLRISPNASAGDTLYWDYVPAPTSWNSGTATNDVPPFIPTWAHPAIEAYAKWKAADWDDDLSSQVGQAYHQDWEVELKKARSRINRLSGKWGPARPGRRRNAVPTSPGVDTGN